jgi:predicted DNA-binding transcriptional regulator AlpA
MAEVARILGVSRQRADAITRKLTFPRAAGSLAAGRVWFEEDIRAWARDNRREVHE